jgi:hypothetical protein
MSRKIKGLIQILILPQKNWFPIYLRQTFAGCPTGAFCKEIEAFLQKSKEICDNGANNYNIPHITLVSFFRVSLKACYNNIKIIDNSLFNILGE